LPEFNGLDLFPADVCEVECRVDERSARRNAETGAMMTQRGLTASQLSMRADTHRGLERNRSTSEAEYIDAALSFALSQLHLAPHGRAIHMAQR
jgi:hypothetical protein